MENPLKSKRGKVAAIVGALVGVVGIALAAFLLSSAISGSISFRDSDADFQVSVAGTSTVNGLDCSNVKADGRDVTINPVVSRFRAPGQTEIPAQSCRITISVTNTGNVPIVYQNWNLSPQLSGVTTALNYDSTFGSTIAPGAKKDYNINIAVARNADFPAGSLSGYLQFTSAGGA